MAPVAVGEAQAPPDPPFLPPLTISILGFLECTLPKKNLA